MVAVNMLATATELTGLFTVVLVVVATKVGTAN